jgi:hypothetical protein
MHSAWCLCGVPAAVQATCKLDLPHGSLCTELRDLNRSIERMHTRLIALIHPRTHSLTHARSHPPTHQPTRSPAHSIVRLIVRLQTGSGRQSDVKHARGGWAVCSGGFKCHQRRRYGTASRDRSAFVQCCPYNATHNTMSSHNCTFQQCTGARCDTA